MVGVVRGMHLSPHSHNYQHFLTQHKLACGGVQHCINNLVGFPELEKPKRAVYLVPEHIMLEWHKLNNKAPRIDGMVTSFVTLFDLNSLHQLLCLPCTPLHAWPSKSRHTLLLVLHKKDGFDLNKNRVSIKLLLVFFGLLAKHLCPHL